MSKGLRTAAQIVGIGLAIAAAIPTGGGSTLLAGAIGVSASAASAIATAANLAINVATPAKPQPSRHHIRLRSDKEKSP